MRSRGMIEGLIQKTEELAEKVEMLQRTVELLESDIRTMKAEAAGKAGQPEDGEKKPAAKTAAKRTARK